MSETRRYIKKETINRLELMSSFEDSSMWRYIHVPAFGPLYPSGEELILFAAIFEEVSPESYKEFEKVKVGDKFLVTVDLEHETWEMWDPTPEWIPDPDFQTLFKVDTILADHKGKNIFVLNTNI
jgi:hypothetical protein